MNDIPHQWQTILEDRFGPVSLREMARQIGMPHPTFIRALKGKTSHATIARVAQHLHLTTSEIYELRGEPAGDPYQPPEQSRLLTASQRAAVDAVINAMLENR